MKNAHCGTDMPTKLAVINCKGQKQTYKCTAEEMYMPSYVHRTQLAFIREYYDAYIILSAKSGVLFPSDVIEPYTMILNTSSASKALQKKPDIPMLTKAQTKEWAELVAANPIFKQYDHIDFHLPNAYWNPLAPHADMMCDSWFRVSYPQSLITTGHRYEQLLAQLLNSDEIDLSMMGKKITSSFPEQHRYYYHNNYPAYKGWARGLVKEYPDLVLDEGALVRVDKTSITGERYSHAGTHHKGWCCDEKNLQYLYEDNKGRWRFNKS